MLQHQTRTEDWYYWNLINEESIGKQKDLPGGWRWIREDTSRAEQLRSERWRFFPHLGVCLLERRGRQ